MADRCRHTDVQALSCSRFLKKNVHFKVAPSREGPWTNSSEACLETGTRHAAVTFPTVPLLSPYRGALSSVEGMSNPGPTAADENWQMRTPGDALKISAGAQASLRDDEEEADSGPVPTGTFAPVVLTCIAPLNLAGGRRQLPVPGGGSCTQPVGADSQSSLRPVCRPLESEE